MSRKNLITKGLEGLNAETAQPASRVPRAADADRDPALPQQFQPAAAPVSSPQPVPIWRARVRPGAQSTGGSTAGPPQLHARALCEVSGELVDQLPGQATAKILIRADGARHPCTS
ncbi:hypothetical protein [Streptomyces sp. NPDC008121]|uniref:hypothetical protein n=1 Tax=Streptomyces sp. NPDC008121 TaxID=3364809 RepID=UPI0036E69C83